MDDQNQQPIGNQGGIQQPGWTPPPVAPEPVEPVAPTTEPPAQAPEPPAQPEPQPTADQPQVETPVPTPEPGQQVPGTDTNQGGGTV